jgi:hypothetical protein
MSSTTPTTTTPSAYWTVPPKMNHTVPHNRSWQTEAASTPAGAA